MALTFLASPSTAPGTKQLPSFISRSLWPSLLVPQQSSRNCCGEPCFCRQLNLLLRLRLLMNHRTDVTWSIEMSETNSRLLFSAACCICCSDFSHDAGCQL